ncbi:hypothetical protein AB0K25_20000 [Micromonospora sp. NPDC049257]|uniref:hypothetical protein n=1 Tax=Micromonospora sp. NPDC049257 TaxID=3155771 RepID=UPI003441DA72
MDIIQARIAGLVDLLLNAPLDVPILADAGYEGLGADTGGAVITPRPTLRNVKPPTTGCHRRPRGGPQTAFYPRIRVEHATGHLKN